MIRLYCRLNHKQEDTCNTCNELVEYAHQKLDKCIYTEEKPACKSCKVHCYSPIKRKEIQQIMRFSGPRMLLYAPLDFLKHYTNGK
jgi:hypothetical protein